VSNYYFDDNHTLLLFTLMCNVIFVLTCAVNFCFKFGLKSKILFVCVGFVSNHTFLLFSFMCNVFVVVVSIVTNFIYLRTP
jgi:hypothetical protein